MHRYKTWNGPMPTTGVQTNTTTGTVVKTMLQLSTPSTRQIQLISWGFNIDAPQNGYVELCQADTAATVTAHVAAGIIRLDPNAPASLLTLGTANTGYTSSSETAPTAVRVLDSFVTDASAGASDLEKRYQFMPDERPIIAVSSFVRVRASLGTAATMQCWICWDE